MVPSAFETFFLAAAGTGGAFIGLLFVAISILPQRTFGNAALGGPQHQHLAEATLFTMVNGFVLSSTALIPGLNAGWITFLLGTIGVLLAIRLIQRLAQFHHHGSSGQTWGLHILRVVSLSIVALIMYASQCFLGFQVLSQPDDPGPFPWVALLIVGFYALAIVRAWTLLGDPQQGWSGWLNPLQDLVARQDTATPASSVSSATLPQGATS